MKVNVRKWGNSASVRIPASVMQAAHLKVNQPVDVREEEGRVVIEPLRQKDFKIDALLSGITDQNLHDEIDFGEAVGKEIW